MGKRRLSLSAGVVLTTALGVSILFHESPSRAADPVTPMNDSRIAALTALDQAVEAVAAHVQPAVVNIQVTSRGSAEDQAQIQGQVPPGLQQFFGPNGPFGGFGFGDDGPGQGNGQRGSRRFQRISAVWFHSPWKSQSFASRSSWMITFAHALA